MGIINENGPCGRLQRMTVKEEVEIFYVPISRRSHMKRKCHPSDQEGSGKPSVCVHDVSIVDKWHSICSAIRDAGNLAIEVGAKIASTISTIPIVESGGQKRYHFGS
ncbi:MAG: hypothetical protein QF745_07050, partial [Planctomycetota bacterium]|nr:hypothetical protein [Planctomycetota bacterium]